MTLFLVLCLMLYTEQLLGNGFLSPCSLLLIVKRARTRKSFEQCLAVTLIHLRPLYSGEAEQRTSTECLEHLRSLLLE